MSKTAEKPPISKWGRAAARIVMFVTYVGLVVLVVTRYEASGFEVSGVILSIAIGEVIVARQPGMKQLRGLFRSWHGD